jgi:hypothetical protein
MGIARNIARLVPNGSGLLPNANIEAVAASKLTGQVADANAPSGSIVQVPAQAITFTQINFTTTTFTDWTGMSVSITPSSTSNRILIIASLNGIYAEQNQNPLIRLLRNSTVIAVGGDYQPFNNAGVIGAGQTIVFIDSPSTTSSVTYKLQYRSDGGGACIINVNDSGGTQLGDESTNSTLTLLEIAA